MNQRDAVYYAVVEQVGNEVKGEVKLTKEQRAAVHSKLVTQFMSGAVDYRGQLEQKTIEKYVPGLVNNWLRKDTRLNGGGKYVPKNPGSRAGSGDETMKAMKALLSSTQDPVARKTIEDEIEKRKAQLKPAKTIDISALPEHLRHLVPASAVKVSGGEHAN